MILTNPTYVSTAASRLRGSVAVAPQSAHGMGSQSVSTTLTNPFGSDITAVTRVRDAKQAAPPRGELH